MLTDQCSIPTQCDKFIFILLFVLLNVCRHSAAASKEISTTQYSNQNRFWSTIVAKMLPYQTSILHIPTDSKHSYTI